MLEQADRLFDITIPQHQKSDDVIYYQFKMHDHLQDQIYSINFRFKDLNDYYQKLLDRKYELPEFPKTHFWRSTNKDLLRIEKRKQKLVYFFNILLNNPALRGQPEIKQFIKIIKKYGEKSKPRQLSLCLLRYKQTEQLKKPKSLQKPKRFIGYSFKLSK